MFVGEHGTLLDVKSELEESGEGVGEVADAEGADEGRNISDVGDCGGDYVGYGPVNGNDGNPHDLSALRGQWWEIWNMMLDEIDMGWRGSLRKISMRTLL